MRRYGGAAVAETFSGWCRDHAHGELGGAFAVS
jgi:hypothetical protein